MYEERASSVLAFIEKGIEMKLYLAAALLALSASAASADVRPTPIRGEVESFSPGHLRVVTRDRKTADIVVPENLQIVSLKARTVADIAVGDAVNTTTVPDGNGGLTALQVSILPPGSGVKPGQRPSDVAPDSVMTTATISGVAAGAAGDKLTMTYEGKSVVVTVPADVPVVSFGQGDAALLKKGAEIFAIGMPAADGSLSTDRVIAETDGVKPPM